MSDRNPAESNALPTEAFEQILPAVVEVIELSQQEIGQNQQKRLALVQATLKLKDRLAKAKEIAQSLPGGDMTIDQQDALIILLERLRDSKRHQLASFAAGSVRTNTGL